MFSSSLLLLRRLRLSEKDAATRLRLREVHTRTVDARGAMEGSRTGVKTAVLSEITTSAAFDSCERSSSIPSILLPCP